MPWPTQLFTRRLCGLPLAAISRVFLLVPLWLLAPKTAIAAPEAHILRIDPRAAQGGGDPVLTTVIEVVQSERVSAAVAPCATLTGNALFSCMSEALERPYALYKPFPFPEKNAVFTVLVEGSERLAKYVSHTRWAEAQAEAGVGTAWLILVDADRRMGKSFEDAKQVAAQFVASMGPNDIANVMFFNDRQVVNDSQWIAAAEKQRATNFISSLSGTYPSQGRTRSLLSIIKQAANDGFKALGNVGDNLGIPMHQAMVVLSNGYGGADAATSGPGAMELQKYLSGGRIPEDNTAMPKAPVPVVSVLFPYRSLDEFRQNSIEFMQNMANPELGGFFTVVQEGQGGRAPAIVNAVRSRFDKMYVVKWRISCLAPTVTQTFRLFFADVKPQIIGDNTFKDVPIGLDPSRWPLNVSVEASVDSARRQGGVHAGGKFKVFGDFCWGGDASRAEAYFLPSGQPIPKELSGTNVEDAKRAQTQLIQMGMKATTLQASDSYAEFEAPDKEKLLHGAGSQALVRLVLYDNRAHRTSGVTADTVLSLPGTTPPFPLMLVLAGALGFVIIALLIVVILRSGSRKGPSGPGGGGPGYGPPGYGGPGPYAQHRGGSLPQASPHQGGPAQFGAQGAALGALAAPITASSDEPQVGAPGSGSQLGEATLRGAPGVFKVIAGAEVLAGSDARRCAILLEPEGVAAVHAALKLEQGKLWLRNEDGAQRTHINGHAAAMGAWLPVADSSLLRLGPVELAVSLG